MKRPVHTHNRTERNVCMYMYIGINIVTLAKRRL